MPKLVECSWPDVIRRINIGRRNRAFEAVDLFEAVTGFERMLASPDSDTAQTPPGRPAPAQTP